jgi:hypothetical protein
MAFVQIIQPPVDQAVYDAVAGKVDVSGNPPDGLILHCAGDADGKWQIIEVWQSEEHARQFEQQRLEPAIKEVRGPDAPRRADATATSYELHNLVKP